MTDFKLEEHRGWAVYTQNLYTGDWSSHTTFGTYHVHEAEENAQHVATESQLVEEVTIRPVSLGADPVQWAAVQMAMALLDMLRWDLAEEPDEYGYCAGTDAIRDWVDACATIFGGSLERGPCRSRSAK